jgi:hypothetical protein
MIKKLFGITLGMWGTIATVFIYVFIVGKYGEYVINREVDYIIQLIATFVVLFYTVWQIKLISNFINRKHDF